MNKVLPSLLLALILITCSKNSTNPEASPVGQLPWDLTKDVIGLIDNFDMENPLDDAIYIDPDNTNSSTDGSIDNPHNSMSRVKWAPGITIAFKRGTILETSNSITIEYDDITLMSYGDSDERPIIESTTDGYAIVGHWQGLENITIRDLEIESVGGNASITFNPHENGNRDISVINCKLHGGMWGLRAMGVDGLTVENTEVFNTGDDGIFARWNNNVEVFNCYIHNVNTNWKPPHTPEGEAGGDALQLDDSDNWHVHHNVFDRSSSGNKFAFIANNPDQRNGILEHNKLIGPKVDGHSIYIGAGSDLIIRYNTITDCPGHPLYSHASNFVIYGNVFARLGGPLFISGSGHIYRNTFHDVYRVADGGKLTLESNIFSFVSSDQKDYNVPKFTQANNLYAGTDKAKSNSFLGNPDFISIENDDFRLGENSDAIDKGTETDMTMDMDGTSILQGAAPDVGAFERASEATWVRTRP